MGVRPERVDLEPPASTATGPAKHVGRLTEKTLQVSGTFVASLQVEGTVDGSNWAAVGAAITTPSNVSIPGYYDRLRIAVTFTSGVPAAVLGGLFNRE